MLQGLNKPLPPDPPMSAEGWVLCITALLMLLAIAWYVVSKIRNMIFDTAPDRESYLGTFHDLREQGVLEETEFQKLKKTLAKDKSPVFVEDKTVSDTDGETLSVESEKTAEGDVNRERL